MRFVGQSVRRLEDSRLTRGEGRFVDDIDVPGQLYVRIIRSNVAHGRITGIDAEGARKLPGVHAVITGADIAEVARIPLRLKWTSQSLDHALQPVLACDRVRYVGEPVAVVVADDPYLAEDAAELTWVDYDVLPAVLDARDAISEQSDSLWDEGGNEVATIQVGYGDVDAALAAAPHVFELRCAVGRHSGVPLETRGIVAVPDEASDRLDIWGWTKVPHFNRRVLSELLSMPLEEIHFHGVDAGGGFGVRGEFYPEDFLVPFLARRLGRPVKWIEDRAEHLVSTNHSRDQHHHITAAFDDEGHLIAMRGEVWHDNGGYLRTHGVTVPELTAKMLPGPYRLPNYDATVHVITTNKTPCGTYRGPGRYEVTFAREQLMSVVADGLGIDRVELRRRNLLGPDEIPYTRPITVLGKELILNTGDYPDLLERTLEASGFEEWQREANEARAEGRLVGTGLAFFLEKSGLGPYETAAIEVDHDGKVRVLSGGASLGQGIETVMAQIAADDLCVALDDIEVIHGDSDLVPDGVGSWASRSTVVGGSAVKVAAEELADRIRLIGADLLGVSADKVVLAEGRAFVEGTDSSVSFGEIARNCGEPGLRADTTFSVDSMNYPYGVHLAQVEIDRVTAGVRVLKYFVGYEVGRAINPKLVEGQLLGGVAQGLGGALLEEFVYGDGGQPLATTFMDYLLPTAAEVPEIGTLICEEAPPSDNPLGAMGAGEGGCTGAGAALANAIDDALGAPGAVKKLPVTPSSLFELLTKVRVDS